MSKKPIPKGEVVDGDMTAALDTRFLNSIVLLGALEKRGSDSMEVTIDRVERHDVLKYENGQKAENAYLLYFKGSDKPLKLGATNINRICLMHGTIGAGWNGKKIHLCLEKQYRPDIKAVGNCVRVRVTVTEKMKADRADFVGGNQ